MPGLPPTVARSPTMTMARLIGVAAPPPVPGVVEAAVVVKLKIWPFVVVPAAFTAITLKK